MISLFLLSGIDGDKKDTHYIYENFHPKAKADHNIRSSVFFRFFHGDISTFFDDRAIYHLH